MSILDFFKSVNQRLASHISELEKLGALPSDWFWHKDRIKKLITLDEKLIDDLDDIHNKYRYNQDTYEKIIQLLIILHKDLEQMLTHTYNEQLQNNELELYNLLLTKIKMSLYSNWTTYPITFDSRPGDEEIGYLNSQNTKNDSDRIDIDNLIKEYNKISPERLTKEDIIKFSKIAFRTPIQERIEKLITKGKMILPYIKKDGDTKSKPKGEAVNKRNTYEEQFFEGHASQGGRIIDVETHVINNQNDLIRLLGNNSILKNNLDFYKGRLVHFNNLPTGNYIWVVNQNGNLIIGNRDDKDGGMMHDMLQMPKLIGLKQTKDKRKTTLPHATLAKGQEVFGAGEVIINEGLIAAFNADSGHYAKLLSDEGGLPEPETFNKQSINVFRYFAKKVGWKEVLGGAFFNSKHFSSKN